MTINLDLANLAAPLRPVAEIAAQFREECSVFDQLVEDLFGEVEQLRQELMRKADEIEQGRRHLAERGRQLAEQRKESSRLIALMEQQEARLAEALEEIKDLREQVAQEREESQQREAARTAFLEQKLRAAEAERDQLRHELNFMQATAASNGGSPTSESLAPLMSELGDLRRQLAQTQEQLGEARGQLAEAIERAAAPRAAEPATTGQQAPSQLEAQTQARLGELERERIELESELELVRTRATELQELVNQQRRELVEQRADVTTELRLLRELVEQQRPPRLVEEYEPDDDASLIGAAPRGMDAGGPVPDPVVSSVMAQFARLQKDVAQRRKKK